MSKTDIEQLRQTNPEIEQQYGPIRAFHPEEHLVFAGRAQAGEGRAFTTQEMAQIHRILTAIGLHKREIIEPAYRKALEDKENVHPAEAWTTAALDCANDYLKRTGQADDEVVVRRTTGIIDL